MRSYRSIVPRDMQGNQPFKDCLVQIHGIWLRCFIASESNGWYCAVFGGRWNEEGEEVVTPAEYTVHADDILVRIN